MSFNTFFDHLFEESIKGMPIRDFDNMLKSSYPKTREAAGKSISEHVKEIVEPYLKPMFEHEITFLAERMKDKKEGIEANVAVLQWDGGIGYTREYFKNEICDFCISYAEEKQKDAQNMNEQKQEKKGFFQKLFSKKNNEEEL